MIRLGFPVRIVGQPALRSHDARRDAPHLSVSLVYLRDILCYLERIGVHYYRVAAALLPETCLATGLHQLEDCALELDFLAAEVRRCSVRLTMHLDHHITLGSPDKQQVARSLATIELQAALLERLGMGEMGALVAHIGGPVADPETLERFAQRYLALSARAQRLLAVEHESNGFNLAALLQLHQQCGVPVVLDYLHWQRNNSAGWPLDMALGLVLATWQPTRRAEVHLSTARTEAHLLTATSNQTARVVPPRPGQHADFIAINDLITLLRAARGLPPFDVMLEAKAGDLALLRCRAELAHVAPELATQVD